MKILVVEDDAFYSQYVAEMLQDRGVEVSVVKSAQESLNADAMHFDGAIVDVMLPNDPEASGITNEESRGGFSTGVCVARRLLQRNPNLRIILLSSGVAGGESELWAQGRSVPFVHKSDRSDALVQTLNGLGLLGAKQTPLAFIVHGHDEAAVRDLKDYIQNSLKWREPIILREQPSSGRTLIEKFEDHAYRVDCVFVLLTPDDVVVSSGRNEEKRRSRQNVLFELGFFCGALERRSGRILLLHKGPVELPSDIAGVVWIDISNGVAAAGEEIRKEVASLIEA